MELKTKSELQHLIELFLKATEDPSREYIYLLEDKYYLLRSVSDYKSKAQKVRLVEVNVHGDFIYEDDVSLVLDAEDFKNLAKIIGFRKDI